MKLSEMSDESCSRWIAEHIEPKPEEVTGDWECWGGDFHGEFLWSPARSWYLGYDGVIRHGDFVNDSVLWSMLMRQLLDADINLTFTHRTLIAAHREHGPERFIGRKEIGRCICEAWMLANGWTE